METKKEPPRGRWLSFTRDCGCDLEVLFKWNWDPSYTFQRFTPQRISYARSLWCNDPHPELWKVIHPLTAAEAPTIVSPDTREPAKRPDDKESLSGQNEAQLSF